MALRINTNAAALTAHRNLYRVENALSQSLSRISSGLRINKAADDASGMIIADSLKSQAMGMGQAIRNASDGISIMQTADGAIQEAVNIINTVKTKAIQAASDGQTTETRKAIQADINKLFEEFDAIAKNTAFNGQKLLSGSFTNKAFQIGAYANEVVGVSIGSVGKADLGHLKTGQLHMANGYGGDIQLTINSSVTSEALILNTIEIGFENDPENGMGALADEVNRYASVTGIKASAVVQSTTSSAVEAGVTGSDFSINQVSIGAVTVTENDSTGALVKAVNEKTAQTGVSASINSNGTLTLTSTDNRAIEVSGSVSGVLGGTAGSLSTLGYLDLVKSGTSQFNLEGIGAGATGGSIRLAEAVTTVEDSVVASGSSIAAGSLLTAGSRIGGTAALDSVSRGTAGDTLLKAGSTLQHNSTLARGTVIGGAVTVSGNIEDAAGAANALTMLEQDMLVAAGSSLEKHSILGQGTVVTTDFTANGVSFTVGDVLSASVRLDAKLTLASDMILAHDASSALNSGIRAGSTLAAGSVAGADIDIGFTWDDTASAVTLTASAAGSTTTTTDLYLNGSDVSVQGQFVFKAGSLLKDSSIIAIGSTGAWSGPTLVTTAGTIEQGDNIDTARLIMLDGDQVISEDFTTFQSASVTQTIKDGSILTAGFQMKDADPGFTSNAFFNASLDAAVLSEDTTVRSGSTLQAGTTLLARSVLGDSTYVSGGVNAAGQSIDLATYVQSTLKAGADLKAGTTLEEGSTIGGVSVLQNNSNLDSQMALQAGSFLSYGSVLKKGTVLSQDMALYDTVSGTGANIIVNYTGEFGANAAARAAFDYAVNVWEGLLDSSVDIVIDADLNDFSNATTLGTGGSNGYMSGSDVAGAAETGARYAMALANAIEGEDNNGALAEIDVDFNSNAGISWYYGTDGNPGGTEMDFVTVVLHEIGHGLGFISNTTSTGAFAGGGPAIYDYFVEDRETGQVFANMTDVDRLAAATDQNWPNQISWNGAFGVDAAGGNPILYSPDPWEDGSSVTHLDETTYNGTADALMTPKLAPGEAIHSPGDIVLGMFQDMGWRLPSGNLYSLKAGDVLTQDMQVGQSGVTLSDSMILEKSSKVAVNSRLAVNTANSGQVALTKVASRILADLSVLTQADAQVAIDIADATLQDLDNVRAGLGSVQNQLTSTIANLAVTEMNLMSSESVIRDVDFADEASNLSRMTLVQQSSTFALAQATASSETILSLLQ